jgi:putative peptidoglycan binding protein
MQGTRRLAVIVASSAGALALIAPAADAARFGKRTLRKGMHGSDVRTLQRYLDRVGHQTAVDGEFGRRTGRAVKAFERDEGRRPDAVVTRSDARLLRRRARQAADSAQPAPPPEAPGEKATLTEDGLAAAPASAPPEVKAVIAAGNRIAKKPYKYGGGHGRWRDSGYDCSGSMSYALHAAGLLDKSLDSTGFMRWGRRGRGRWITTRANSGHSYMVVAGLRFDTSAFKSGGSRWTDEMRSARGYRGRHPVGL